MKSSISVIVEEFRGLIGQIKTLISLRSISLVLLCWSLAVIIFYSGQQQKIYRPTEFTTSNLTDSNWDSGVSKFANMILVKYDGALARALEDAHYLVLEDGTKVNILSVKIINNEWIHVYLSQLNPELMRFKNRIIIQ